jgi:hypothetical protein
MADHTENALAASIKALTEVVTPALGTADPVAVEQLRLVIGFLKFLQTRWPLSHARGRFELDHSLRLAQSLIPDARSVSTEVHRRLETGVARAQALLGDAAAGSATFYETSADLSAAVSALLRAAAEGDSDVRQRVERAVLTQAKVSIDAQRAWHLPMGFELEPGELPSLQTLFGAR